MFGVKEVILRLVSSDGQKVVYAPDSVLGQKFLFGVRRSYQELFSRQSFEAVIAPRKYEVGVLTAI